MDEDVVLVDPWADLRGGGPEEEAERLRIAAEIRAEVVTGHALHGIELDVVGRSFAKDDVLVRVRDGRWAIVHLTYQRPDTPPWPGTRFFDTTLEVEAALIDGA